MANSDNPIFNTVNDVLGLGRPAQNFGEKIRALEVLLTDPKKPFTTYAQVMRADAGRSAIEGSERASGKQVSSMFTKLNKLGLVPDSAQTAFDAIGKIGGSVFYNPDNKTLFYGSPSSRVSPLPLQLAGGTIGIGEIVRKVNSLGMDSGKYPMSFGDAFYTQFGANILDNDTRTGIHKSIKFTLGQELNKNKLSSLLLDSANSKGYDLSFQGSWTSGRSMPYFDDPAHYFVESLNNYKVATAAHSMLIKTGGRKVYDQLADKKLSTSEALGLIRKYKSDYLERDLPRFLQETGTQNAFLFVKPDFLGNKDKFLLPDASLNRLYGTQFESHTASKGLYHLANIRQTTDNQITRGAKAGYNPYSYYTLAGESADRLSRRDMRLKIGIVDTTNPLYSQMYFGEGGVVFSDKGIQKFATQLPKGSMKIGSPTLLNIAAAERLFGVNLAQGYTQSVNNIVNFTDFDVKSAFDIKSFKYDDLTQVQKDIRVLFQGSNKYSGLVTQLARENSALSKIKLTDSFLSLDFVTAGDTVAPSMEIVGGGRRFTGTAAGPLKQLANSLGVDALMGADEYAKTFGANVYLTNFIEKVSETKIAEKTFLNVFGQNMYRPAGSSSGMAIPMITDHDSAYKAAKAQVDSWMAKPRGPLRKLAESIEHGTQVLNTLPIAGITGVRIVGMAGGLRTDFLMTSGNKTFGSYPEVMRAERGMTAVEGSQIASGKQVRSMFTKLNKLGLVPDSAETAFDAIGKIGGSVFYHPTNNTLHYGSLATRISALPLQLSGGTIGLGDTVRKVNSLAMDSGKYPMSFADVFYTHFGGQVLENGTRTGVHRAIKNTLNNKIGPVEKTAFNLSSLLLDSANAKGYDLSFQGPWTAGRSMPYFNDPAHYFVESLNNYRVATAAHSMLVKTAGRKVYDELSPTKLNTSDSFSLIRQYKSNYLEKDLPRFLQETGTHNAFLFVKPDFLGNKDKFLLPDANLNKLYGTLFEGHTASKGLFHLTNIRETTNSQIARGAKAGYNPYSYYTLAGESAEKLARRDMRLRVGIVDTTNPLYSQLYFGEGAVTFSDKGIQKFATQLPKGSMKIGSPTLLNIEAAERLFGVNLGQGYTQSVNNILNFNEFDVRTAFDIKGAEYDSLSQTQKDIRTLFQSNQKYSGLMKQLVKENTALSKIKLTDSYLSLDFVTAGDTIAPSMEFVAGGRRFTGTSAGPLKQLANSLGVDFLMGADEYAKTFGANVYLTNFIEQVSDTAIAEQTFLNVFGQKMYRPSGSSKGMAVPMITDHDSAYRAAKAQVDSWMAKPRGPLRKLAERIEHGAQVLNSLPIAGIAGVRVVGMAGGFRTDFMGDINMMKPVKFTPSKMSIISRGSAQLGYFNNDDPMYNALVSKSRAWKSGSIFIDPKSGQLGISSSHPLKKMANALLGHGTPDVSDMVSMSGGQFYYKGQALSKLPGDVSLFSHGSGGYSQDDLGKSILGIKKDMVFVDLGKEVKMNLLGIKNGEKMYRYLPVPIKYLRMQQGSHGKITVNKSHPSYEFLSSLINLEHGRGSDLQYGSILKAIVGSKGLFAKSSTIVVNSGTRVRLTAGQLVNDGRGIAEASTLFDSTVSGSQFNDWLRRKEGIVPDQVRRIRESVKKKGFFHAIVGVDPMQRAEHANIHRIYVDSSMPAGKLLGQLNLIVHPFWPRMTERDFDRDVANLTPLTDNFDALEDRIARQARLSKPFMSFYHQELKTGNIALSKDRFPGMKFVEKLTDYLGAYLGVPKSLGYTITRASDSVMSAVTSGGVEGAAKLGILNKNITSSMVDEIAAPYLKDPEKMSVVQKALQYLYQGAVQKGKTKSELVDLSEELVKLGQKYKGKAYKGEAVKQEASELLYAFLKSSDKNRGFMLLEHLGKNNLISEKAKESTELMLADLQRGSASVIDDAASRAVSTFREETLRATANLLGEYLGPAMVLAAGIRRAPKTLTAMIQKNIYGSSSEKDIVSSVLDAASDTNVNDAFGKPAKGLGEDLTSDMRKKAANIKAGGFNRRLKATLRNNKAAIGMAAGIGALAGAAIVGLSKGPQAPLPREPDGKQPTDLGPQVYQAPPKIYSTNQKFNASRNRNNTQLSSVAGYGFKSDMQDTILIRNKYQNNDSRALEQQMKQIANSDYTY